MYICIITSAVRVYRLGTEFKRQIATFAESGRSVRSTA